MFFFETIFNLYLSDERKFYHLTIVTSEDSDKFFVRYLSLVGFEVRKAHFQLDWL